MQESKQDKGVVWHLERSNGTTINLCEDHLAAANLRIKPSFSGHGDVTVSWGKTICQTYVELPLATACKLIIGERDIVGRDTVEFKTPLKIDSSPISQQTESADGIRTSITFLFGASRSGKCYLACVSYWKELDLGNVDVDVDVGNSTFD